MLKLIIIRGYPGSGKTTIGKLLETAGYGTFIDHNSLLTFIAAIVGNDDGIYDDIHALELAMVNKLLRENTSVIVARGFSRASSLGPYLKLANNNGADNVVIRLDADKDTLKKRVAAPERKKDFNPTTDSQSLAAWVKSNPLEEVEAEHSVNASRSLDTVVANIKTLLS